MITAAPVVPTSRSANRSPNSRPNDGSMDRVDNCLCIQLYGKILCTILYSEPNTVIFFVLKFYKIENLYKYIADANITKIRGRYKLL